MMIKEDLIEIRDTLYLLFSVKSTFKKVIHCVCYTIGTIQ
jgi:hypothetical protein